MVSSGNNYKDKVSQLISWGHWFSFFNIIAAMLLGSRYIAHSEWPASLVGQFYLLLSWVGHFGFLVFGFYILILFPASFLIPSQRLMRLFAVLVATTGLTALLLDTHAYETLELHLSPLVWDLLLSGERTELNARWQYLFITVPVIFLLQLVLSEWLWRKLRKLTRKHVGVPIATVFGICFISSHLLYIWADANLYRPITAQRSNFPLSYPMTAKTFMEKHGLLDREEYAERLNAQGVETSEQLRYPLQKMAFNDPGTGKNLLVIVIDGLRSDMVEAETMPYLSAFATQNIDFENHYSSSNENTAGIFGLFYGLPSSYINSARSSNTKPLLISTLEKRGYQFGLFGGDNLSQDPIYTEAIFNGLALEEITGTSQDAEAVDNWASWLESEKTNSPWFSYIELTSVQNFEEGGDYSPKFEPSLGSNNVSGQNTNLILKNSYRNAAHFIDEQLIRIFDQLVSQQLMDDTIVIITANHGTEFNETGSNSWGANSNYSQYQLKVPLVIHWPGSVSSVSDRLTSHLDIAPTLMESLLNTTTPATAYSSGNSLFSNSTKRRWILAGNEKDIVMIQPESTTVIDKYGNYLVYNQDYKRLDSAKPKLSTLMQAMHEMKRFYKTD
ncbi:DUF3413 domain-containing protein [Photobacterium sp. DNB23_23_1]|uniref:DUF3413 domain-containing protein n=1 Tax=Photobacterium pectinilyticum TaxID=2906793 RepID=A0ABT1N0C6_9GAMM|nr:DUF3413 domain-containing protein [Photobacterium sp. ZSDE20]MCQ1058191.1 DUF3413 domain-containing protein [Photobacterium sp. ZSDE20]MDD1822914.1 DUF3413 domain-containing protein [Photobacterium sp. ZSDE20]